MEDTEEESCSRWVLDSSLVHYEETFEVTVRRNGLGLGFSITGCGDLIRIKKIFPLQPAWETGKLRAGDILLKVCGVSLNSLNAREALDLLRCSPPSTVLTLCRPFHQPSSEVPVQRSYSFTPVNTLWDSSPTTLCDNNPISSREDDSLVGEFIVVLKKINGSLGFTIKDSQDTTILRHSVKALVKEPSLSNGRIKPGDKLISANNVDCSNFSHSELVKFLRSCPEDVVLKLYRDASRSQTPVMSPDKPFFENNNHMPLKHCNKTLRHEAVEMVKSLQASRSSLQDLSNPSSCTSSLNRRGLGSRPFSPKPRDSTVLSPATSLPIIESPDTPTEESVDINSLPPMFFARNGSKHLCIEDVTDSSQPAVRNSDSANRPDSLDLSAKRQRSTYAFHSFNKK